MPNPLFIIWLAIAGALQSTDDKSSRLGGLPIWDDGLAEMCYYDATTSIYGKPRHYTRVHLVNREWFELESGVKTDQTESATARPVLKLNIAEEIPTANYNYRYLTTLFANRATLWPHKLVVSSQEWCGSTFKHLRWRDDALHVQSFSYFEGAADATTTLPANVLPFEAAFLIAREVALGGAPPADVRWLPPVRTNRAPRLTPIADAKWEVGARSKLQVKLGEIECVEVRFTLGDATCRFWVETAPPHRLVKFAGFDESFELVGYEHRAYWDARWTSNFYPPNDAP